MRAAFFRLLISLLSLGLGCAEAAPVYRPPHESVPLIRRDLVPLDVSAIQDLANDLATLAESPVKTTGAALRERAQLLTLTLRLAPAQNRAREIERRLRKQTFSTSPHQPDLAEARRRSFLTAKWLLALPPESEGARLGQLLLDVLAPFQKNHPLLKKGDATKADERWSGVIAPLAEFENKPSPAELEPTIAPAPPAKYLATGLFATTPLITQQAGRQSYGAAKLSLLLTEAERPGSLYFKPDLAGGNRRFSPTPLYRFLKQFAASRKQPLPANYDLFLDTGFHSYAQQNKTNILAPLAMMLDAAITGRELDPKVIFFAKLEADGSLTRPAESWPLLQSLRDKEPPQGTRLLVPSSLAEELTAMLVIEEPALLLRFEFIACDRYSEAQELFFKDSETPEDLQKASASFQEVSQALSRISPGNLASSLVHDSVKSRLRIAAAHPRHLSARVLLQQATGNRPAFFTTFMFARELAHRTSNLLTAPPFPAQMGSRPLKDYHSAQREILSEFRDERRISQDDLPLLAEAFDLVDELRPISRELDEFAGGSSRIALTTWRRNVLLFRRKLQQVGSDPDP